MTFHSFQEYLNWCHHEEKLKKWRSEIDEQNGMMSTKVKLKSDKQNWLKEALEFSKYFGHEYFSLDLRRAVNKMEADLDVPRDDTAWDPEVGVIHEFDETDIPDKYDVIHGYEYQN
jgi:hypothetical protein